MNLRSINEELLYESYKLTWNVDFVSLRNFEVKSREFKLRRSSTKWYVVLNMQDVGGGHVRCYVQVCRSEHDNYLEDIATRVSLEVDSLSSYEDYCGVFQRGTVLKSEVGSPGTIMSNGRLVCKIRCLIGVIFQLPNDFTGTFRKNNHTIDIEVKNTLIEIHRGILFGRLRQVRSVNGNDPNTSIIINYPPPVVTDILQFEYAGNIGSENRSPYSENLYECADQYGFPELVRLLKPQNIITRNVIKEHVHVFKVSQSELSNFRSPRRSDDMGNVFYKLRLTDCFDCTTTCLKVTIEENFCSSRTSSIFTTRNKFEILEVILEMPHYHKTLKLNERGFSWINSTACKRYVSYSFIPKQYFVAQNCSGSSTIILSILFRLD